MCKTRMSVWKFSSFFFKYFELERSYSKSWTNFQSETSNFRSLKVARGQFYDTEPTWGGLINEAYPRPKQNQI